MMQLRPAEENSFSTNEFSSGNLRARRLFVSGGVFFFYNYVPMHATIAKHLFGAVVWTRVRKAVQHFPLRRMKLLDRNLRSLREE